MCRQLPDSPMVGRILALVCAPVVEGCELLVMLPRPCEAWGGVGGKGEVLLGLVRFNHYGRIYPTQEDNNYQWS